jgi:hypothetical protein
MQAGVVLIEVDDEDVSGLDPQPGDVRALASAGAVASHGCPFAGVWSLQMFRGLPTRTQRGSSSVSPRRSGWPQQLSCSWTQAAFWCMVISGYPTNVARCVPFPSLPLMEVRVLVSRRTAGRRM